MNNEMTFEVWKAFCNNRRINGKKVCFVCNTEYEYYEFYRLLDSFGYKWCNKEPLLSYKKFFVDNERCGLCKDGSGISWAIESYFRDDEPEMYDIYVFDAQVLKEEEYDKTRFKRWYDCNI